MRRYAERLKKLLWASLIISIILHIILVTVFWVSGTSSVGTLPIFHDFSAYFQAGVKFINAESLYASTAEFPRPSSLPERYHGMEYLYPPIVVIIFIPLSFLSFWTAGLVWTLLSLMCISSSILYLYKLKGETLRLTSSLFLLLLIFGFYPVKQSIYMGQITLILTAVLTLSVSRMYSTPEALQDKALFAIFNVFPVFIKPYYAPILLPQIKDRQKMMFSGIFILILGLLSVFFFGPAENFEYLNVILEGRGRASSASIRWTGGPYEPLYVFGKFKYIPRLLFFTIVTIIGLITVNIESKKAERYLFVLGISTFLLLSPGAKYYTLVVMIPAILISFWEERARNSVYTFVPIMTALLIHSHKVLFQYSPLVLRRIGFLNLLIESGPYIQPAVWGVLSLFVLSAYRLLEIRFDL